VKPSRGRTVAPQLNLQRQLQLDRKHSI
jgi:hypothetical protein